MRDNGASALDGAVLEVARGHNGRLFLASGAGFDIARFTAVEPFSATHLARWRATLESWAAGLASKSIPLTVLIAPDAHTAVSEDLPTDIQVQCPSPAELAMEALQGIPNLNFVWPLQALRAGKDKFEIYRLNDSHWTAYGAYLAYRTLADSMRLSRTIAEDEVQFEAADAIGDLGAMTDPETVAPRLRPILRDRQVPRPRMLKASDRNNCQHSTFAGGVGTAVVMRDSFYTEMNPYVSCTFAQTWAYGTDLNLHFDLVERVGADHVILILAERRFFQAPARHGYEGFAEIYETEWTGPVGRAAAALFKHPGDLSGAGKTLNEFGAGQLSLGHRFIRAKAALLAGEGVAAAQEARQLVLEQPTNAAFLHLLARALLATKAAGEAQAAAAAAVAANPHNGLFQETHVYATLLANGPREAVLAYRSAIDLVRDHAQLFAWGSEAMRRSGDLEGGKEAITAALRLSPDHKLYLEWAGRYGAVEGVAQQQASGP